MNEIFEAANACSTNPTAGGAVEERLRIIIPKGEALKFNEQMRSD